MSVKKLDFMLFERMKKRILQKPENIKRRLTPYMRPFRYCLPLTRHLCLCGKYLYS